MSDMVLWVGGDWCQFCLNSLLSNKMTSQFENLLFVFTHFVFYIQYVDMNVWGFAAASQIVVKDNKGETVAEWDIILDDDDVCLKDRSWHEKEGSLPECCIFPSTLTGWSFYRLHKNTPERKNCNVKFQKGQSLWQLPVPATSCYWDTDTTLLDSIHGFMELPLLPLGKHSI